MALADAALLLLVVKVLLLLLVLQSDWQNSRLSKHRSLHNVAVANAGKLAVHSQPQLAMSHAHGEQPRHMQLCAVLCA